MPRLPDCGSDPVLLRLLRLKVERRGVHAIAQPGRGGTVFKNMPQVRATTHAARLGTNHAVSAVFVLLVLALTRWLKKTWPACPGIELGGGVEQRLPAADAMIGSGVLRFPVLTGKGRFGARLASHVILLRSELLFPLRFALCNLFCMNVCPQWVCLPQFYLED